MKKLLALTLISLAIVSTMTFAETTKPTTINPQPVHPVDYRSYTGFKISYGKEFKDGKITLQTYHTKMNNKDMFLYYVQYCVTNNQFGTCSYFYSNGWVEGKVAGNNWIIRDGSFNAVLGKNIGHLKTDSISANLKIE